MTTQTPTPEIEKWILIRVRFFANFWLRVGIRVRKKNAGSCRSRPRYSGSGTTSDGYGVDGRLILAVKSLYSCSEVCVRVRRVKSWPFAVGGGLRQGCVLSPLLFIVYINGSQLFRWREPNPDLRFYWRLSVNFFTC